MSDHTGCLGPEEECIIAFETHEHIESLIALIPKPLEKLLISSMSIKIPLYVYTKSPLFKDITTAFIE